MQNMNLNNFITNVNIIKLCIFIIIMVFNLIEIQLVAESIQLVGYLELSPYKIMEHSYGKLTTFSRMSW